MKNRIREFIYRRYNISFSKAGDDIQLKQLLKATSPGTYVDIGCWHPVKASNTYYFYLRNWKGICIDPNPQLKMLYQKTRPKDIFINSGIALRNETKEYIMFEESSINTFSEEFVKSHNLTTSIIHRIKTPVAPLAEILSRQLGPTDRLDFFDIYVEGMDLEVLRTNDWKKFRPRVVLIETDLSIKDEVDSEISEYLFQQDYKLIGKSVINGNLGNLFFITS